MKITLIIITLLAVYYFRWLYVNREELGQIRDNRLKKERPPAPLDRVECDICKEWVKREDAEVTVDVVSAAHGQLACDNASAICTPCEELRQIAESPRMKCPKCGWNGGNHEKCLSCGFPSRTNLKKVRS